MEVPRFALLAMIFGGLILGPAGKAAAFEGRYVGSIHHHPGLFNDNRMQHLLDLGTRSTVYGGADLRLWLNLSYASDPGTRGTDLLKTRINSELRKSFWRFHSQIEPWQDGASGPAPPRKRRLDFGLDINPRNAPQIQINWLRTDRESPLAGTSKVEDRRIRVSHGFSGGGVGIGYRRLDSGPVGGGEDRRHTDDWQADLRRNWNWRTVSVQSSYEGQYTQTRFRERRIKYYVNRLNLGGGWTPHRKLRFGGSATARAGKNEDNSIASAGDIDERFLSGRVNYLPVKGMDLSLIREYRDRATGPSADYWQAQAQLRREVIRRVSFHGGLTRTQDLRRVSGTAPKNSAFLILDGRLRRSLAARVEARASWEEDVRFLDTQWQRLAQLRMYPGPASRVEVTWRATDDPRVGGTQQKDDAWEIFFGYRPVTDLDLALTYRTLDGTGRVDRSERFRSVNSSWSVTRATSLSGNWSWRKTRTNQAITKETVTGVEARVQFPRRWVVRATFRHLAGSNRGDTDTYGLILEKRF